MHTLVKLITDDSGEEYENPTWHAINPFNDSHRTLCEGHVYGFGESHAIFEIKRVERGVPCPKCQAILRYFKSIKL